MKNWIYGIIATLILLGCSQQEEVKSLYGEDFNISSPISTEQLIQEIDSKAEVKNTQVEGVVEKSCGHTGCWLTLKNSQGKTIYVTYKDDAFTTAKNLKDRKVVLQGEGRYNQDDEEYEFIASGLKFE
ncbi:MAG: DUF4920 domain-containing protein [Chitinophagales bacterium]|nr:DUF4920 domain-containing protein [Chitinophagales bacterium]MCZ2393166.1 DUF4920 domain-containing protein [Chitinophagales bacterium]